MADPLSLSLAKAAGGREALLPFKGAVDALQAQLSSAQAAYAQEIAVITAQLQGIAGYRQTSLVDDRANFERTVGQTAVVQAVKADPTLTESQAKKAWRTAALASRPAGRQWLLCDPDGLLQEYQANLGMAGWEAFRAWIVATPVDQMGL